MMELIKEASTRDRVELALWVMALFAAAVYTFLF